MLSVQNRLPSGSSYPVPGSGVVVAGAGVGGGGGGGHGIVCNSAAVLNYIGTSEDAWET